MKFNCGAKRHHYSMFNVGRSMFDVQSVQCSMFSLFNVQNFSLDLKKQMNLIAERSDIIIRCSTLDVRCWMFSLFDVRCSVCSTFIFQNVKA
jgi:hypothetical protein